MSRKKKDEETGTSKPFFARYLEGQHTETSSAKVGGSRSHSYKKAAPAGPITLKAPSDKDELVYVPQYITLADIPEKFRDVKLQTLKYPSDKDEQIYEAVYTAKTQVPKTATPAATGTLKLKKQSAALKRR